MIAHFVSHISHAPARQNTEWNEFPTERRVRPSRRRRSADR